jgi:hypothetical protein
VGKISGDAQGFSAYIHSKFCFVGKTARTVENPCVEGACVPQDGVQEDWSFTAQCAEQRVVAGAWRLLPRLSTTLPTVVGGNLWV